MQRLLVIAVAIALALAAAAPARAGSLDEARAHYERATSLYALGKYGDAATEYERAFELKPDPALLYNAAQAHRIAGNKARALTLYQNFLRVFSSSPNAAEVERHVVELRQAIAAEEAQKAAAQKAAADKAAAQKAAADKAASDKAASNNAASDQAAARAATAPATSGADLRADATTARRAPSTPVYKRWWLWTAVGVAVAAGVGLGIGLGVSQSNEPTYRVSNP